MAQTPHHRWTAYPFKAKALDLIGDPCQIAKVVKERAGRLVAPFNAFSHIYARAVFVHVASNGTLLHVVCGIDLAHLIIRAQSRFKASAEGSALPPTLKPGDIAKWRLNDKGCRCWWLRGPGVLCEKRSIRKVIPRGNFVYDRHFTTYLTKLKRKRMLGCWLALVVSTE